uniref:C2CD3 N-terminal C2 domain-containing protein n=1 Tax=Chromera velia CCMP2878 TaxID=1169474 RepID=A0A0G4HVY3_9ALVE|eukprot:Cvel_8885.t1-p1 / transcript=Cvel_8885.t1 / gene=Cvel_8885 / organism=Chromera_velia_CCMP2878 / gene_product=hypothetical protein / transcript_product=hypothetical protein / location=Cvel_scaffold500:5390-26088(+) / protein_length=5154 / sequence_SO=supercontig / SO=protein_coding / is_pseudo=false
MTALSSLSLPPEVKGDIHGFCELSVLSLRIQGDEVVAGDHLVAKCFPVWWGDSSDTSDTLVPADTVGVLGAPSSVLYHVCSPPEKFGLYLTEMGHLHLLVVFGEGSAHSSSVAQELFSATASIPVAQISSERAAGSRDAPPLQMTATMPLMPAVNSSGTPEGDSSELPFSSPVGTMTASLRVAWLPSAIPVSRSSDALRAAESLLSLSPVSFSHPAANSGLPPGAGGGQALALPFESPPLMSTSTRMAIDEHSQLTLGGGAQRGGLLIQTDSSTADVVQQNNKSSRKGGGALQAGRTQKGGGVRPKEVREKEKRSDFRTRISSTAPREKEKSQNFTIPESKTVPPVYSEGRPTSTLVDTIPLANTDIAPAISGPLGQPVYHNSTSLPLAATLPPKPANESWADSRPAAAVVNPWSTNHGGPSTFSTAREEGSEEPDRLRVVLRALIERGKRLRDSLPDAATAPSALAPIGTGVLGEVVVHPAAGTWGAPSADAPPAVSFGGAPSPCPPPPAGGGSSSTFPVRPSRPNEMVDTRSIIRTGRDGEKGKETVPLLEGQIVGGTHDAGQKQTAGLERGNGVAFQGRGGGTVRKASVSPPTRESRSVRSRVAMDSEGCGERGRPAPMGGGALGLPVGVEKGKGGKSFSAPAAGMHLGALENSGEGGGSHQELSIRVENIRMTNRGAHILRDFCDFALTAEIPVPSSTTPAAGSPERTGTGRKGERRQTPLEQQLRKRADSQQQHVSRDTVNVACRTVAGGTLIFRSVSRHPFRLTPAVLPTLTAVPLRFSLLASRKNRKERERDKRVEVASGTLAWQGVLFEKERTLREAVELLGPWESISERSREREGAEGLKGPQGRVGFGSGAVSKRVSGEGEGSSKRGHQAKRGLVGSLSVSLSLSASPKLSDPQLRESILESQKDKPKRGREIGTAEDRVEVETFAVPLITNGFIRRDKSDRPEDSTSRLEPQHTTAFFVRSSLFSDSLPLPLDTRVNPHDEKLIIGKGTLGAPSGRPWLLKKGLCGWEDAEGLGVVSAVTLEIWEGLPDAPGGSLLGEGVLELPPPLPLHDETLSLEDTTPPVHLGEEQEIVLKRVGEVSGGITVQWRAGSEAALSSLLPGRESTETRKEVQGEGPSTVGRNQHEDRGGGGDSTAFPLQSQLALVPVTPLGLGGLNSSSQSPFPFAVEGLTNTQLMLAQGQDRSRRALESTEAGGPKGNSSGVRQSAVVGNSLWVREVAAGRRFCFVERLTVERLRLRSKSPAAGGAASGGARPLRGRGVGSLRADDAVLLRELRGALLDVGLSREAAVGAGGGVGGILWVPFAVALAEDIFASSLLTASGSDLATAAAALASRVGTEGDGDGLRLPAPDNRKVHFAAVRSYLSALDRKAEWCLDALKRCLVGEGVVGHGDLMQKTAALSGVCSKSALLEKLCRASALFFNSETSSSSSTGPREAVEAVFDLLDEERKGVVDASLVGKFVRASIQKQERERVEAFELRENLFEALRANGVGPDRVATLLVRFANQETRISPPAFASVMRKLLQGDVRGVTRVSLSTSRLNAADLEFLARCLAVGSENEKQGDEGIIPQDNMPTAGLKVEDFVDQYDTFCRRSGRGVRGVSAFSRGLASPRASSPTASPRDSLSAGSPRRQEDHHHPWVRSLRGAHSGGRTNSPPWLPPSPRGDSMESKAGRSPERFAPFLRGPKTRSVRLAISDLYRKVMGGLMGSEKQALESVARKLEGLRQEVDRMQTSGDVRHVSLSPFALGIPAQRVMAELGVEVSGVTALATLRSFEQAAVLYHESSNGGDRSAGEGQVITPDVVRAVFRGGPRPLSDVPAQDVRTSGAHLTLFLHEEAEGRDGDERFPPPLHKQSERGWSASRQAFPLPNDAGSPLPAFRGVTPDALSSMFANLAAAGVTSSHLSTFLTREGRQREELHRLSEVLADLVRDRGGDPGYLFFSAADIAVAAEMLTRQRALRCESGTRRFGSASVGEFAELFAEWDLNHSSRGKRIWELEGEDARVVGKGIETSNADDIYRVCVHEAASAVAPSRPPPSPTQEGRSPLLSFREIPPPLTFALLLLMDDAAERPRVGTQPARDRVRGSTLERFLCAVWGVSPACAATLCGLMDSGEPKVNEGGRGGGGREREVVVGFRNFSRLCEDICAISAERDRDQGDSLWEGQRDMWKEARALLVAASFPGDVLALALLQRGVAGLEVPVETGVLQAALEDLNIRCSHLSLLIDLLLQTVAAFRSSGTSGLSSSLFPLHSFDSVLAWWVRAQSLCWMRLEPLFCRLLVALPSSGAGEGGAVSLEKEGLRQFGGRRFVGVKELVDMVETSGVMVGSVPEDDVLQVCDDRGDQTVDWEVLGRAQEAHAANLWALLTALEVATDDGECSRDGMHQLARRLEGAVGSSDRAVGRFSFASAVCAVLSDLGVGGVDRESGGAEESGRLFECICECRDRLLGGSMVDAEIETLSLAEIMRGLSHLVSVLSAFVPWVAEKGRASVGGRRSAFDGLTADLPPVVPRSPSLTLAEGAEGADGAEVALAEIRSLMLKRRWFPSDLVSHMGRYASASGESSESMGRLESALKRSASGVCLPALPFRRAVGDLGVPEGKILDDLFWKVASRGDESGVVTGGDPGALLLVHSSAVVSRVLKFDPFRRLVEGRMIRLVSFLCVGASREEGGAAGSKKEKDWEDVVEKWRRDDKWCRGVVSRDSFLSGLETVTEGFLWRIDLEILCDRFAVDPHEALAVSSGRGAEFSGGKPKLPEAPHEGGGGEATWDRGESVGGFCSFASLAGALEEDRLRSLAGVLETHLPPLTRVWPLLRVRLQRVGRQRERDGEEWGEPGVAQVRVGRSDLSSAIRSVLAGIDFLESDALADVLLSFAGPPPSSSSTSGRKTSSRQLQHEEGQRGRRSASERLATRTASLEGLVEVLNTPVDQLQALLFALPSPFKHLAAAGVGGGGSEAGQTEHPSGIPGNRRLHASLADPFAGLFKAIWKVLCSHQIPLPEIFALLSAVPVEDSNGNPPKHSRLPPRVLKGYPPNIDVPSTVSGLQLSEVVRLCLGEGIERETGRRAQNQIDALNSEFSFDDVCRRLGVFLGPLSESASVLFRERGRESPVGRVVSRRDFVFFFRKEGIPDSVTERWIDLLDGPKAAPSEITEDQINELLLKHSPPPAFPQRPLADSERQGRLGALRLGLSKALVDEESAAAFLRALRSAFSASWVETETGSELQTMGPGHETDVGPSLHELAWALAEGRVGEVPLDSEAFALAFFPALPPSVESLHLALTAAVSESCRHSELILPPACSAIPDESGSTDGSREEGESHVQMTKRHFLAPIFLSMLGPFEQHDLCVELDFAVCRVGGGGICGIADALGLSLAESGLRGLEDSPWGHLVVEIQLLGSQKAGRVSMRRSWAGGAVKALRSFASPPAEWGPLGGLSSCLGSGIFVLIRVLGVSSSVGVHGRATAVFEQRETPLAVGCVKTEGFVQFVDQLTPAEAFAGAVWKNAVRVQTLGETAAPVFADIPFSVTYRRLAHPSRGPSPSGASLSVRRGEGEGESASGPFSSLFPSSQPFFGSPREAPVFASAWTGACLEAERAVAGAPFLPSDIENAALSAAEAERRVLLTGENNVDRSFGGGGSRDDIIEKQNAKVSISLTCRAVALCADTIRRLALDVGDGEDRQRSELHLDPLASTFLPLYSQMSLMQWHQEEEPHDPPRGVQTAATAPSSFGGGGGGEGRQRRSAPFLLDGSALSAAVQHCQAKTGTRGETKRSSRQGGRNWEGKEEDAQVLFVILPLTQTETVEDLSMTNVSGQREELSPDKQETVLTFEVRGLCGRPPSTEDVCVASSQALCIKALVRESELLSGRPLMKTVVLQDPCTGRPIGRAFLEVSQKALCPPCTPPAQVGSVKEEKENVPSSLPLPPGVCDFEDPQSLALLSRIFGRGFIEEITAKRTQGQQTVTPDVTPTKSESALVPVLDPERVEDLAALDESGSCDALHLRAALLWLSSRIGAESDAQSESGDIDVRLFLRLKGVIRLCVWILQSLRLSISCADQVRVLAMPSGTGRHGLPPGVLTFPALQQRLLEGVRENSRGGDEGVRQAPVSALSAAEWELLESWRAWQFRPTGGWMGRGSMAPPPLQMQMKGGASAIDLLAVMGDACLVSQALGVVREATKGGDEVRGFIPAPSPFLELFSLESAVHADAESSPLAAVCAEESKPVDVREAEVSSPVPLPHPPFFSASPPPPHSETAPFVSASIRSPRPLRTAGQPLTLEVCVPAALHLPAVKRRPPNTFVRVFLDSRSGLGGGVVTELRTGMRQQLLTSDVVPSSRCPQWRLKGTLSFSLPAAEEEGGQIGTEARVHVPSFLSRLCVRVCVYATQSMSIPPPHGKGTERQRQQENQACLLGVAEAPLSPLVSGLPELDGYYHVQRPFGIPWGGIADSWESLEAGVGGEGRRGVMEDVEGVSMEGTGGQVRICVRVCGGLEEGVGATWDHRLLSSPSSPLDRRRLDRGPYGRSSSVRTASRAPVQPLPFLRPEVSLQEPRIHAIESREAPLLSGVGVEVPSGRERGLHFGEGSETEGGVRQTIEDRVRTQAAQAETALSSAAPDALHQKLRADMEALEEMRRRLALVQEGRNVSQSPRASVSPSPSPLSIPERMQANSLFADNDYSRQQQEQEERKSEHPSDLSPLLDLSSPFPPHHLQTHTSMQSPTPHAAGVGGDAGLQRNHLHSRSPSPVSVSSPFASLNNHPDLVRHAHSIRPSERRAASSPYGEQRSPLKSPHLGAASLKSPLPLREGANRASVSEGSRSRSPHVIQAVAPSPQAGRAGVFQEGLGKVTSPQQQQQILQRDPGRAPLGRETSSAGVRLKPAAPSTHMQTDFPMALSGGPSNSPQASHVQLRTATAAAELQEQSGPFIEEDGRAEASPRKERRPFQVPPRPAQFSDLSPRELFSPISPQGPPIPQHPECSHTSRKTRKENTPSFSSSFSFSACLDLSGDSLARLDEYKYADGPRLTTGTTEAALRGSEGESGPRYPTRTLLAPLLPVSESPPTLVSQPVDQRLQSSAVSSGKGGREGGSSRNPSTAASALLSAPGPGRVPSSRSFGQADGRESSLIISDRPRASAQQRGVAHPGSSALTDTERIARILRASHLSSQGPARHIGID